MKDLIKSLSIIFGCLLAGDTVSALLNIPIPGSIIGMVLLLLALNFKLVKLKSVKPVTDLLNKEMAFFFIPPGVGLMLYFDLLEKEWPAIMVACVVSTLIIIGVVGIVSQKMDTSDD
ncbi:hypothetical protein FUAX_16610 [Fulvitalea axinellae]|uniref:CidA/LrgA family protein n=1 Tax=Fulvitalea axinellae TaxID=1182444 RepID=A0AAU9D436_9BACT|nr:hypothetical protein FUAX_16610 [Fulvitalea axinellae]